MTPNSWNLMVLRDLQEIRNVSEFPRLSSSWSHLRPDESAVMCIGCPVSSVSNVTGPKSYKPYTMSSVSSILMPYLSWVVHVVFHTSWIVHVMSRVSCVALSVSCLCHVPCVMGHLSVMLQFWFRLCVAPYKSGVVCIIPQESWVACIGFHNGIVP